MPNPFASYFRLYRESISGFPRATWVLAWITLVHRAAQMVLLFQTLYFDDLGLDGDTIAILLVCYGIGNAIGAYVGGWLSDQINPVHVMGVSLASTGLLLVSIPFVGAESVVLLHVMMFALGVIGTAFRPAATTILAATCPPEKRSQAFAFYRLPINLGSALGPAVGGFLAEIHYHYVFFVEGGGCALTSVLVWIFLLGCTREADEPESASDASPERSPWRDGLFLLLVANTGMLALVVIQWFSAGTLFLKHDFEFSESQIGLLFAMNPILIVLFEMVIVQKLKDRRLLPWIAGSGWLVAASCLVVLFPAAWPLAVASVLLWTAAEMVESPLTGSIVAQRAGKSNRGRYMGVYILSYSIAHGLGPGLGTALYFEYGPRVMWGLAATVSALCAILVAIAARRHKI